MSRCDVAFKSSIEWGKLETKLRCLVHGVELQGQTWVPECYIGLLERRIENLEAKARGIETRVADLNPIPPKDYRWWPREQMSDAEKIGWVHVPFDAGHCIGFKNQNGMTEFNGLVLMERSTK